MKEGNYWLTEKLKNCLRISHSNCRESWLSKRNTKCSHEIIHIRRDFRFLDKVSVFSSKLYDFVVTFCYFLVVFCDFSLVFNPVSLYQKFRSPLKLFFRKIMFYPIIFNDEQLNLEPYLACICLDHK